jgi:hypothetical protein
MSAGFRAVEAHRNGDCGFLCPLCDFEEAQLADEHASGAHEAPHEYPDCPDCVDARDRALDDAMARLEP